MLACRLYAYDKELSDFTTMFDDDLSSRRYEEVLLMDNEMRDPLRILGHKYNEAFFH
jgi:hypothetical protein